MTKRKKKIWIALGALAVVLVGIRAALPGVLLRVLNDKLGKIEGPLCAHMNDLDISVIKGMYSVQDLTVSRWKPNRSSCDDVVLRVQSLDVSLSWPQLIRGKARLNVESRYVDLFADDLMNAVKSHKAGDSDKDAARQAKAATDVLIPWRVDALALTEGKIHLKLLGTDDSSVTFDHAEGTVTGIEQSRQTGIPTMFRLKGNIFYAARLLVTGSVNMAEQPVTWDVDYGVERVALTQANRLLLNRAPISFTSGLMDVYGEAAGGGTQMQGYTKLLFRDIDVVAAEETFKNFKHGLIEVIGSLFFIVAKSPKRQTAGTIINFGTENGEFKVDIAGTVSSALAHRTGSRPVVPGIENRLSLPKTSINTSRAESGTERSL
jgi:hypothetical protein